MLCEIITIGDEILIGQIVDTNSAWMAQQLNLIGIKVKQISSVSDDREHILKALKEASERVQMVLITGGLGPTKDDITKKTLCEYFGCEIVFNEAQYQMVEKIFSSFGREVTPINRKQAEVPEICTCLVNQNGTAPGMWFDVDDVVYVSMPGVPYEMMGMMSKQVLPMLKERFKTPVIRHRTFRTQGVGESLLASWIEGWEDALPAHMKLAYLPAAGQVRLRISAIGEQTEKLDAEIEQQAILLYELIGKHIYAEGEVNLEEVIHHWMIDNNKTMSTAESCTGGTIASMLTKLPGASKYFEGSTVCYSYDIKERLLGVKSETLNTFGAVSEETVMEMAAGALRLHQSDYTLAVSGIAGPDGGTEEKPVGTVWIAVGGPDGIKTKKFRFSTNRERNITMASLSALNMLRKYLLKVED